MHEMFDVRQGLGEGEPAEGRCECVGEQRSADLVSRAWLVPERRERPLQPVRMVFGDLVCPRRRIVSCPSALQMLTRKNPRMTNYLP